MITYPSPTSMPRGANPSFVMNVLTNLVKECKAAGQASLTIEDLETAIKAISR